MKGICYVIWVEYLCLEVDQGGGQLSLFTLLNSLCIKQKKYVIRTIEILTFSDMYAISGYSCQTVWINPLLVNHEIEFIWCLFALRSE